MALALAALYAAGGLLTILSLLLPHPELANEAGAAANAALALVTATALWAWGGRLPLQGFHVLIAIGSVLISLGIHFAGYLPGTPSYAFFYLWVIVYSFSFFPVTWAMGQSGVAAAGHLLILSLDDQASFLIADWSLTWGVLLVTGFVVGWLSGQVEELAVTDTLTGVRNRRAWEDELTRELAKASRTQEAVSVVLLDVDGLKQVNDTGGHQAGDRLLKEAAAAWSAALRAGDFMARLGGDEFGILLTSCTESGAKQTIERLRAATSLPFSAGSAEWKREETSKELMHRADLALYRNKRAVAQSAQTTAR
ncbi:MAG: GGDEF domain-containing protein [Actinomycetota bacterium]|nr:GGDEF domain-containing protein [Actinomycetota bacterium]